MLLIITTIIRILDVAIVVIVSSGVAIIVKITFIICVSVIVISGAIIIGTLLDELERTGAGVGLATLCIGGGMGIALTVER